MIDKKSLEDAISSISPEVLALDDNVGSFLDLVSAFLDVKVVKYKKFESKNNLGDDIKSILIEDNNVSVQISEAIPSWKCGTEVFVKMLDNLGISISSLLDKPSGIVFATKRNSTDLEITVYKSTEDQHVEYGIEIVTSNSITNVELKNVLKIPSKFPGIRSVEGYYVDCKCQNEKIDCIGHSQTRLHD